MDGEQEEEKERGRAHYQVNCFLAPKVLDSLPWLNPVNQSRKERKQGGKRVILGNGTVVNESSLEN